MDSIITLVAGKSALALLRLSQRPPTMGRRDFRQACQFAAAPLGASIRPSGWAALIWACLLARALAPLRPFATSLCGRERGQLGATGAARRGRQTGRDWEMAAGIMGFWARRRARSGEADGPTGRWAPDRQQCSGRVPFQLSPFCAE